MTQANSVLLSLSYFGPIQYFTKFLLFPSRIIEIHDNYTKQTYRNRCNIYGANGVLTLSIPVLKGDQHKTYVRDVRIDYSKNWQKLHWKGIESAYMHSPFFEFYLDEVRSLLESKPEFLLDLNLAVLDFILETLEIEGGYLLTEEFLVSEKKDWNDFREIIHPKTPTGRDRQFHSESYAQVFAEKHGFKQNLSILDLLFNEGPNAGIVLEKCIISD